MERGADVRIGVGVGRAIERTRKGSVREGGTLTRLAIGIERPGWW